MLESYLSGYLNHQCLRYQLMLEISIENKELFLREIGIGNLTQELVDDANKEGNWWYSMKT